MDQFDKEGLKARFERVVTVAFVGCVAWLPERYKDVGINVIALGLLALWCYVIITVFETFVVPGFFRLITLVLP